MSESGAENDQINLKACQSLRKRLKQRSAALTLTVNDLLALYRALHAGRYQPSAALVAEMKALAARPETRPLAVEITRALEESRRQNPALLHRCAAGAASCQATTPAPAPQSAAATGG